MEKPTNVESLKEESPSDGMQNESRENLIATAVHFLSSDRVQSSPMEHKRAFLLKKGLTNEEIDQAVERANKIFAASPKQGAGINQNVALSPHNSIAYPPSHFVQPVQSGFMRFRDVTSSVVMISVAGYGVYYLYKRYIEPWLLGQRYVSQADKMEQLQQSMQELTQAVLQLREIVAKIEKSSQDQTPSSESVEVLRYQSSLTELKQEVTSLKALMLGRKQFPETPRTIPAWQMAASSNSNNGSSSNHVTKSASDEALNHHHNHQDEDENTEEKESNANSEDGLIARQSVSSLGSSIVVT